MKFKKRITKQKSCLIDEQNKIVATYLEFTGEKYAWSRGQITKTPNGWKYENAPCDPSHVHQFSSAQLRQIADKIDELNGEQK